MSPVIRLALLSALAAALLALAGPALAAGSLQANIPYDGTIDLKNVKWPAQKPFTAPAGETVPAAILAAHGEPDIWLTLFDNTPGHQGPYLVPFWKEYVGCPLRHLRRLGRSGLAA